MSYSPIQQFVTRCQEVNFTMNPHFDSKNFLSLKETPQNDEILNYYKLIIMNISKNHEKELKCAFGQK